MAKPNKAHKQRCENYKKRGQREINKKIKQEKDKKRIEKFARRREDGKAYKYEPLTPPADDVPSREKSAYLMERKIRAEKNVDHRTDWARNRSYMQKLQNELDKAALEEKKKLEAANGKKKNK